MEPKAPIGVERKFSVQANQAKPSVPPPIEVSVPLSPCAQQSSHQRGLPCNHATQPIFLTNPSSLTSTRTSAHLVVTKQQRAPNNKIFPSPTGLSLHRLTLGGNLKAWDFCAPHRWQAASTTHIHAKRIKKKTLTCP